MAGNPNKPVQLNTNPRAGPTDAAEQVRTGNESVAEKKLPTLTDLLRVLANRYFTNFPSFLSGYVLKEKNIHDRD